MRRSIPVIALVFGLLLLAGCGQGQKRGDRYLGNLADTSYANRRAKTYPSATGDDLYFADFAGRFVWVDFAAPWCPPCAPQAQVIKQLEHNMPGVVFVTLMTSDQEPMSPATSATARSWASRFGLERANVAACAETRVIPSHMLFSPKGQLLYWKEGGHTLDMIQSVLAAEVPKWNREEGALAR